MRIEEKTRELRTQVCFVIQVTHRCFLSTWVPPVEKCRQKRNISRESSLVHNNVSQNLRFSEHNSKENRTSSKLSSVILWRTSLCFSLCIIFFFLFTISTRVLRVCIYASGQNWFCLNSSLNDSRRMSVRITLVYLFDLYRENSIPPRSSKEPWKFFLSESD